MVNMRPLRLHSRLAPGFRLLRSAWPQGVTRCCRPAVRWPAEGPGRGDELAVRPWLLTAADERGPHGIAAGP